MKIAEVMAKGGGRGKLSLEERKLVSAIPGASKYLDILSRLPCSYAEGKVRPWEFKQGNSETARKHHEKAIADKKKVILKYYFAL